MFFHPDNPENGRIFKNVNLSRTYPRIIVCLLASVLVARAQAQIAPMDLAKPPEKDADTILLLHFDTGEGTVALDESGLESNGTISDGAWVDGKFGKGIELSGKEKASSVACGGGHGKPPHFDFGTSTDFTIELWLKSATTKRGGFLVTKKLRGDAKEPGFQFFLDNVGAPRAVLADGKNLAWVAHTVRVLDGKWHHIALVVDRKANAVIYVDGVPSPPSAVTHLGDITNPERELRIGDRAQEGNFQGAIDEVRVSKAARPMAGKVE